jgi:hypothetical protein
MIGLLTLAHRRASRAMAGVLLLVIGAACGGDGLGPLSEAALPVDSTASDTTVATPTDPTIPAPTDSTVLPPTDSTALPPIDSTGLSGTAVPALDLRSKLPGIVFASDNIPLQYFNSVHNGSKYGGTITPSNVLSVLAEARAKGGRILLKLHKGRDSFVKNADGTFSLTKWKALVDGYRSVNLGPYIADGTLVAHFIIDEPHRTAKWGGKIISHATLEAMAQYSKQIWPTWTTITHTQTPWLAKAPFSYRYLDAGWTHYAAGKGELNKWIAGEIAAAKSKRLGLLMGLNVLMGGNGSSGIKGWSSGTWAMSASEVRTYGTAVLNQSYACAFFLWAHDLNYYGRSDIKSAMAALSTKAKAHAKTSCQQ